MPGCVERAAGSMRMLKLLGAHAPRISSTSPTSDKRPQGIWRSVDSLAVLTPGVRTGRRESAHCPNPGETGALPMETLGTIALSGQMAHGVECVSLLSGHDGRNAARSAAWGDTSIRNADTRHLSPDTPPLTPDAVVTLHCVLHTRHTRCQLFDTIIAVVFRWGGIEAVHLLRGGIYRDQYHSDSHRNNTYQCT